MTLAETRQRMREWAEAHRPRMYVTEGSLPHKIYLYWQRRSKKHVANENLCHFVRALIAAGLFLLRDISLGGPKIHGARVPILPILTVLAGLGTALYLWTSTFLQVLGWIGLAVWVILGLVIFTYWFGLIKDGGLDWRHPWDTMADDNTERTVLLVLSILTLPVLLGLGLVACVLLGIGYFIFVLMLDEWEVHRKVGKGLSRFFTLHPQRAAWLTPAWLVLIPIGYMLYEFEAARWIVGALLGVIVVAVGWAFGFTYINDHYLKPARERERLDRERRQHLRKEQLRQRWRQLVAEPTFKTWLWESEDRYAKILRAWANNRGITPHDSPLVLVQLYGDNNMHTVENMFVLWLCPQPDYHLNTVVMQPPPPSTFQVVWGKVSRPFRAAARGTWWLLKGAGQLFGFVVTALWSAKLVGICPMLEFKPAGGDTTEPPAQPTNEPAAAA